jgi:hypothetical protein
LVRVKCERPIQRLCAGQGVQIQARLIGYVTVLCDHAPCAKLKLQSCQGKVEMSCDWRLAVGCWRVGCWLLAVGKAGTRCAGWGGDGGGLTHFFALGGVVMKSWDCGEGFAAKGIRFENDRAAEWRKGRGAGSGWGPRRRRSDGRVNQTECIILLEGFVCIRRILQG